MSNSYYVHATYPTPNSPGSSATLRNELELITDGFDKLPALSGNSYKVVMVNPGSTALTASAALQNISITASSLNNTSIGATSPSTGAFTTASASSGFVGNLTGNVTGNLTGNTNGPVTSNNATITGGSINGTVIGGSTPQAITGTTVTATTGFVGGLTGNVIGSVTGNLTGNVVGNVTGNITGDLTGNITASSGSSSFNNVTINGQLDMNGATSATITNLSAPTNDGDAATKLYVDSAIANVIDSAPGALDTLNELAAALNDDANFSTTITNSIATKLPLTGGSLTGSLAMGTNRITGLGDPTANQDGATKYYVDEQRDTRLAIAGGQMNGPIAMGGYAITGLLDPVNSQDATTKGYIDTLYGSTASASASATASANSASSAATSASNAATSESLASSSASAALNAKTLAQDALDEFTDIYLGASTTAPTTDSDGDPLQDGALWFDTVTNVMKVYNGSAWVNTGSTVNGTANRYVYTATESQTTFDAIYEAGYVDVFLNGVKQLSGTDFTATNGTSIVFASPLIANDVVDIVAYGTFELINVYTKVEANSEFLSKSGGSLTGAITFADGQTFPGYLPLTGGTLTGPITFTSGQTFPDYLPLSGGVLTGHLTFAAGQAFPNYLPLSGGNMTGPIGFSAGQIIDGYLQESGGTMTGDITFSPNQSFPGTASTGKAIAMSIVFG